MGHTPISNDIRKLRFLQDEMTHKELAGKVGVTRQTINAIENAKYAPSLELAFRIATVFDAPPEKVFSYDPKRATWSSRSRQLLNGELPWTGSRSRSHRRLRHRESACKA